MEMSYLIKQVTVHPVRLMNNQFLDKAEDEFLFRTLTHWGLFSCLIFTVRRLASGKVLQ